MIQRPPLHIEEFNLKSVVREDADFHKLVSAYQSVFGTEEHDENGNLIWGEGFKCKSCGKTYSFNEVLFRVCVCGGELEDFYTKDGMKERLLEEIADNDNQNGFCYVLKEETNIIGFIWGAVTDYTCAARRILKNALQGRGDIAAIEQLLHEDKKILYVDELGLIKGTRKGYGPLYALIKKACMFRPASEIQSFVFWTTRRSQMYRLATLRGFTVVGEFDDICILRYVDRNQTKRYLSFLRWEK